jgi:hypothetical protein
MRCDVGTLPVEKSFFSKIIVAIYILVDDLRYVFRRWWGVHSDDSHFLQFKSPLYVSVSSLFSEGAALSIGQ